MSKDICLEKSKLIPTPKRTRVEFAKSYLFYKTYTHVTKTKVNAFLDEYT